MSRLHLLLIVFNGCIRFHINKLILICDLKSSKHLEYIQKCIFISIFTSKAMTRCPKNSMQYELNAKRCNGNKLLNMILYKIYIFLHTMKVMIDWRICSIITSDNFRSVSIYLNGSRDEYQRRSNNNNEYWWKWSIRLWITLSFNNSV